MLSYMNFTVRLILATGRWAGMTAFMTRCMGVPGLSLLVVRAPNGPTGGDFLVIMQGIAAKISRTEGHKTAQRP